MPRLCELILKDQLNRVPAPDAGTVKLTWYPGVNGRWPPGVKDGVPRREMSEMSEISVKTPFSISSPFFPLPFFVDFVVKNRS